MTTTSSVTTQPIYYENAFRGNSLFVSCILFDGAPVQCYLANPDTPTIPLKTIDNSDDATNVLVYEPYPNVLPLRIITMTTVGAKSVAVSVYYINQLKRGIVDPQVILEQGSLPVPSLVSTIRFSNHTAAGHYLHLLCIGSHICVVARNGLRYLNPPRYSGTTIPFHSSTMSNTAINSNNLPFCNIYGAGFSDVAAITTTNLPVQVAPFVCKPIESGQHSSDPFVELASALFFAEQPVPCGNVLDNIKTTVAMYRTPFYNPYQL